MRLQSEYGRIDVPLQDRPPRLHSRKIQLPIQEPLGVRRDRSMPVLDAIDRHKVFDDELGRARKGPPQKSSRLPTILFETDGEAGRGHRFYDADGQGVCSAKDRIALPYEATSPIRIHDDRHPDWMRKLALAE